MMITSLVAIATLSSAGVQSGAPTQISQSLPRVADVLGKPLSDGAKAINTHFGKDQDWQEIDHPNGKYSSLVLKRDPNPETEMKEGRLPWMVYQVTSGPTRGRGLVIHSVSFSWVGATKWPGALKAVGLDATGVKTADAKPMQGTRKATSLGGIKGLPSGAAVTLYEIDYKGATMFLLTFHVDITKP
ncbi:MAG: hypothetical protein IT363_08570 [Methanoregulaceae archaeon]|nr:hypothetical protein [Methanoregulaceae archaeon]